MKQIVGYWRDALRADWNLLFFAIFGTFLLTAIALNYTFGVNDAVMALRPRGLLHTLACIAYYGIPFYFAFVSYALCYRRRELLRNRSFWLVSLVGIVGYAVYAGNWGVGWLETLFAPELRRYVGRSAANLVPAAGGLFALAIVWRLIDREVKGFYGLFAPRVALRPYLGFLLLGMPFVVAATFRADFTAMYPRFPFAPALAAHGIAQWQAFGLFEVCYGLAFVFTEVFFRGFLVIGLSRRVGPAAIMPMVAFYAFIHFGKPMGEALASIVGGWALGVIALRTGSVRGGILFHLGVAYALEVVAWLQRPM
jgi:Type II CAAX prenyl endopeptidase Rce1-like